MPESAHYALKKKYYELLAVDPDYPAWQDFEWMDTFSKQWERMLQEPLWDERHEYRYNPLLKKWEPKYGWYAKSFGVSKDLTGGDCQKLQAYATKLSWLREQGGYEFKPNKFNCMPHDGSEKPNADIIYMSEEQCGKWLEMLKNGEV